MSMKRSSSIATEPIEKPGILKAGAVMLFLALFAFPIYPLKLTNGILIAFFAATTVAFLAKPVHIGKPLLRNLIFFIPFIPYVIEAFVRGFEPSALFEFEKKLFFCTAPLFVPVFFAVTKFKNYQQALLIFAVSVTLLTMYSFGAMMTEGSVLGSAGTNGTSMLLRDRFEFFSKLHPTYYSVFALLSAVIFFQISIRAQVGFRILLYVLAVLLIVVVFILAARIAFIIAGVLFIIWLFVWKASRIRKLIVSGAAAAMLMAALFLVPSLNERFREVSAWARGGQIISNTFSQRVVIMDCALEVFGDNLLLGTSATGSQASLNECYVSKGMQVTADRSYNPHNQYLSVGINYGIFILLVFLAALFWLFRRIFRLPEGIYFGATMILVFMTESILDRQMGVYAFGLIGLLLYNSVKIENPKTVNL
jgi:O-antigen ligase